MPSSRVSGCITLEWDTSHVFVWWIPQREALGSSGIVNFNAIHSQWCEHNRYLLETWLCKASKSLEEHMWPCALTVRAGHCVWLSTEQGQVVELGWCLQFCCPMLQAGIKLIFSHKPSVLTSLCHYHSTPFGNLNRTIKGQLFQYATVKCIVLERHMLSFFKTA